MPNNSTVLSWVFIPEKGMFPYTRRLVPECSVAQFAKATVSDPSGMGTWTMAWLFHGVVSGNTDKQTRVAWIHVNTPLEYNVKPKSKLQKDICRTLPFIWSWTISKTRRGMVNPKLTLVVVGIQGRDCKGASGGFQPYLLGFLFCFVLLLRAEVNMLKMLRFVRTWLWIRVYVAVVFSIFYCLHFVWKQHSLHFVNINICMEKTEI